MPTIAPSSATPMRRSPPSVLRKAAIVFSTAWVMTLSSFLSSRRFQRSVDLNSSVFDSPCLISSSAWRCARRYWSNRKFLHDLAEGRVVGDALVEIEVGVDDLLDGVLDLLVEGEADILAGIDARGGVEGGVAVEALHHLAEREPVLGAEVEAETLVELGDDPREGSSSSAPCPMGSFVDLGSSRPPSGRA